MSVTIAMRLTTYVFVLQAEGEVQTLTKKVRELEENFEQTETRLQSASEKLEEATKAADDSERQVVDNSVVSAFAN